MSGALSLPSDSCLSCGRRNPATFHPLFEGGLCHTCRVRVASRADGDDRGNCQTRPCHAHCRVIPWHGPLSVPCVLWVVPTRR